MRRKVFGEILLVALAIALPVSAQQCGPGCPACSGKSTGDLLPEKTVLATGLYIPDGEEETAVFNLRYGLFSWMDAGVGYARDAEELIWSLRVQAIAQDRDGWRPGLIFGTGSVQTGGSDQSAYAQLAKTWEIVEGTFGVSVSGGYATDVPDLKEDWGIGTVSLSLFDRVSPFYTYDGINSHAGLSVFATEWLTLSAYALEMEDLAIMVGVQLGFGDEERE